jgi:hypothetical protein
MVRVGIKKIMIILFPYKVSLPGQRERFIQRMSYSTCFIIKSAGPAGLHPVMRNKDYDP